MSANTLPPLTYRAVAGVPLTASQIDGNFSIVWNGVNTAFSTIAVVLNADGTLKAGAITNPNQFQNNVVPLTALAAGALWLPGDLRNTLDGTTYNPIATPPPAWLECDGSQVLRATFLNLWLALGGGTSVSTGNSPWGNGDGTTTFNLPDFRGRSLIGQGTGSGLSTRNRGSSGGEETHLLVVAEMPSHTHNIVYQLEIQSGGTTPCWTNAGSGNQSTTTSAGGDAPHNNMQPWAAVRVLIKT